MKKIICVCLVALLLTNLAVPVFAAEAGADSFHSLSPVDKFLTTDEESMPHLSRTETQTYSQSTTTLNIPSRSAWVNATTATLEKAYSQKVISITETKDFVIFTFEEPEKVVNNVGYISKVKYTKPESKAIASNYETKITYMYGWLNGYYSLEEKTGAWNTIKDSLLTVAGFIEELTIYMFVFDVLGIAYNYFSGPEIVRAQNTAQYYVLNKIGQVKNEVTGLWQQWAYVGCRRGFHRTLVEEEVYPNYWNTVGIKETIANNPNNPTNHDTIEVKPNFYNDTWIMNRAISAYERDRVFMDVYGMTIYFSNTLPH